MLLWADLMPHHLSNALHRTHKPMVHHWQPCITFNPPQFPGCLAGKHRAKKNKKHNTHTNGISMTERDCRHSRLQHTWKMGFRRRWARCRGNIADALEGGIKVRVLYLRTAPSAPPGSVQIRTGYQTWSGVLGRGGSPASLRRGLSWSHLFPLFSCRVAELVLCAHKCKQKGVNYD